jgi:hypothetical protein
MLQEKRLVEDRQSFAMYRLGSSVQPRDGSEREVANKMFSDYADELDW